MNKKIKLNFFQKSYTKINKFVSSIEYFLLFIASISLILILISIIYGVFSREVLNSSLFWTTELSSYLMAYLIFLSAPWVLKENSHISVDIFIARFKGRLKRINIIITSLISSLSCGLLFWFSMKHVIKLYQNETVMLTNVSWPKFALFLPIALGFLFLVIRFGLIILQNINFSTNENTK